MRPPGGGLLWSHGFLPVLLILWLLAAPAQAQLTWAAVRQDFHCAPEENELKATYTFQNSGSKPIEITRISTSCGCTAAQAARRRYEPGESGEVTVQFTFGGRRGEQRKTTSVTTSDGQQCTLELDCWIEDPLSFAPALVFWRIGDAPAPKTVSFTLSAPALHITAVKSSSDAIRATLLPATQDLQRQITIEPTDTAAKLAAQVTVTTDYPSQAPKSYVVHVRIK